MNAEKEAWMRFRQGHFDSRDLGNLLSEVCAGAKSFCGRFGDFLLAEAGHESTISPTGILVPVRLRLNDFPEWRSTRRVDGVVPLSVPVATDIRWPVRDLVETLEGRGLRLRAGWEENWKWQDEVSLCWLALLHGRELELSAGMPCRLVAECVSGSSGQQKREISLMGYLPTGGRITVFFSPLAGAEFFRPSNLADGYTRRLHAVRTEGGMRLVEAK